MNISKTVLEGKAQTLLEKAEGCLDLAKTQHNLAETLHEAAAMQLNNADKQQAIASLQHRNADNLQAKADKLETLGQALIEDAAEIKGETEVNQRGR